MVVDRYLETKYNIQISFVRRKSKEEMYMTVWQTEDTNEICVLMLTYMEHSDQHVTNTSKIKVLEYFFLSLE